MPPPLATSRDGRVRFARVPRRTLAYVPLWTPAGVSRLTSARVSRLTQARVPRDTRDNSPASARSKRDKRGAVLGIRSGRKDEAQELCFAEKPRAAISAARDRAGARGSDVSRSFVSTTRSFREFVKKCVSRHSRNQRAPVC